MKKLYRRALVVCSTVAVGAVMPALAAASLARPAIFHRPRIPASRPAKIAAGWASSNWSGYAVTGATYSSVTGTWVTPAASASRKASYSSSWVGIDGYNNSDLIQVGTDSDYYHGAAHYSAWWEILPAPETTIPSMTVKPGDIITASISKGSGSGWTITITDGSQTFSTAQTYTGPQTSAEWIEEAPTLGRRTVPLANYGQTTFDPGTVNGTNPLLTASEAGIMVQKRAQVSTPSDPDGDGDGFNVAYGGTAPAPPSS
jgi:hypothetical protein